MLCWATWGRTDMWKVDSIQVTFQTCISLICGNEKEVYSESRLLLHSFNHFDCQRSSSGPYHTSTVHSKRLWSPVPEIAPMTDKLSLSDGNIGHYSGCSGNCHANECLLKTNHQKWFSDKCFLFFKQFQSIPSWAGFEWDKRCCVLLHISLTLVILMKMKWVIEWLLKFLHLLKGLQT